MVDDAIHKFIKLKEEVGENVEALRIEIVRCTDAGMKDYESVLYNEICSLEEELESIDNEIELDEIITSAKTIEKKIDLWLASQGKSTMSLPWPSI